MPTTTRTRLGRTAHVASRPEAESYPCRPGAMTGFRRAFRYRLYPNRTQARALTALLDGGRCLAALEQRRTEWRAHRRGLRYRDQAKELKAARDADPVLVLLNYSCCQDVLRRLDKTFDSFFRRCKRGETTGYPRFKGRDRFNSVTFPTHGDGVKLGRSKFYVQNVGAVRIKLHRPVEGEIKTVTLRREPSGHWYACFSCNEVPARVYPPATAEVGIDVGLTVFATLSTGEQVENPRWYRATERKLANACRLLAAKAKGTSARRRAKLRVARLHEKAREQRRDFQHKLAHRLVSEYGLIAVENLHPSEMTARSSAGLRKSILDAAWAMFLTHVAAKAEEAGRTFVRVPPRGTSSTCSRCGAFRQKTLAERVHCCDCGLVCDRDINASLNILALGRSAGASPGIRSRLL
jgi:putative transposase